jgi:glucose-1-phosphate cytidylyltransferase
MTSDIPVILLAGGFGTRISEETINKPKPMVNIGEKPILWHVMSIYASQGFSNFKIATGYKYEIIDEWINSNNKQNSWGFDCRVNSVFTGENTQTGGRVRKILEQVDADQYMLTYGDGLANINLHKLLGFHDSHGKVATVTSVRPPSRFGVIQSDNGLVTHFGEKNQTDSGWINGGYFVLNKSIAKYLGEDSEPFEQKPMSQLVLDSELMTYQHHDFWQPMDTLREKLILDEMIKTDNLKWLENFT